MLRSTFDVFPVHSFQEHTVFFRYFVESSVKHFQLRTVVGTTVMFRHFHAKSLEIAKQNSERLFNFSPHEPRIHAHGPTRPMAAGEYEYRLFIVPN